VTASPLLRRAALRAALCLSVALAGCRQPEPPVEVPVEGRAFPKVTLVAADGATMPVERYRGRLVVLNVWATWCPPCRREMPGLEALSKALDPKRFAVVGLSTDADTLLAREFLEQNNITFANFHDGDRRIVRQFGLDTYPETFVIGPDGTLVARVTGIREWDSADMVRLLENTWAAHAADAAAAAAAPAGTAVRQ